ncbi:DUF559 domain-containing protein [Caulobacter sp. 17J65-9]|uniref:endonuclease domain-containing protein n=1 Tax=Caulobacter sp. 17J65-9 TaxID=2709382 RepID=UPI0013CBD73F|nr:DUF559 domain-containing protein [Caulobacter sp. 17J65-9]NEX92549.1 endonuclease domain-containing protein [Caulobacter sp. 17J65-9]
MPTTPLTDLARDLRERQTRAEALLWNLLRNRRLGGWKWKRQVPRGRFIVDFYCADAKLVVELDGGIHELLEHSAADQLRTEQLEADGLRVLRFDNKDLFDWPDRVCDAILAACSGEAPHPALSPFRGEGSD